MGLGFGFFQIGEPGGELVADGGFDLNRLAHRGARHHAVMMGFEIRERAARGVEGIHQAPIEAEEMDVRDGVAAKRKPRTGVAILRSDKISIQATYNSKPH